MTSANCDTPDPEYALQRCISPRQSFHAPKQPTLIGGNRVFGSPKISLCEDRKLKSLQNLKCEDRRIQNCLVLTTEDLATKPDDWRFGFLSEKIWLLHVFNWEDDSSWYPHLRYNSRWKILLWNDSYHTLLESSQYQKTKNHHIFCLESNGASL